MAQVEEIIVEVKVDAGETAQKLADVKQKMNELKAERKALNDAIKESGTVEAEQAQRLAEIQGELKGLTAEEKMYTAQLNTATDGNKEYGKSLTALSAELAKMKNEYQNMSKEMRESEKGQALLKNIQQLDTVMKDSDASIGVFTRNVGNYQSALLGLGDNATKVASLFAGGFKNGIMAAGNAVKAFTKTMLLNPVIAAVLVAFKAFMVVLDKIKEGFARNDEAGTRLQVALERFRPVVDAVSRVFVGLANVISKVVEWASKGASVIIGWIPGFRKASEAAAEHVKELDALEQAERDYAEHSAERQNERAKLEDEARNNTELTTQQRIEKMQQALELERQDMEERRDIAKRKWEAAKEEAERIGDTSDATMKRISDLRVAYINSETEFFNGTRRIQKSIKSFQNELESDAKAEQARRKAAWQKAQADRKQAAQTELAETRKLEDMIIASMKDLTAKSIKETQVRYTREIEDLKRRLKEEKNLTVNTKIAINRQITLLEAQLAKDVKAIQEAASNEEIERIKEQALKNYDLQQQFAEESRQVTALQMNKLFGDMQIRLNDAMKLAGDNAIRQSEAQLQYAREYLAQLSGMDAEQAAAMFENFQDWQIAVQQANMAVMDAEKAVQDAIKANNEELKSQIEETETTLHAITSALGDLYEAAGEDAESYEKFKKALAIVDAIITMAKTIAAATAISASEGDAYTMALRIAANVAAVTAQFASVIASIKSAQIPSAGSYATGGIVPGESYTGDRMTAAVNSGEMILTKAQQQHLFDLLAAGVPRGLTDYRQMAQAFREAVEDMPAPVLDYRELVMFGKKVSMIERKLNS